MRPVLISLSLVVLATVAASGCCSPAFVGPLSHGAPFPEQWRLDFYAMRGEYIKDYWDCDDMSQVYAEYLFSKGVDWKDMRLMGAYAFLRLSDGTVITNPLLGNHMWLEVRVCGEWYIFDMAARKWAYKMCRGERPYRWGQYQLYEPSETGVSYWDGSGYRNMGDRFNHKKLVWVSEDGEEFSVAERTDDRHRKEVIANLETIREDRGGSTE